MIYYDIWEGIVCRISPWYRLFCLFVVLEAGVCRRVLMMWIVAFGNFEKLKYGMYQGYGAATINKNMKPTVP